MKISISGLPGRIWGIHHSPSWTASLRRLNAEIDLSILRFEGLLVVRIEGLSQRWG